jgi:hypothetical protein
MRVFFKRLLWISATFLFVWLVVIFYWKSSSRLPAQSELVLYLGVLPLVLLGTGWAIGKGINYRTKSSVDGAPVNKTKTDAKAAELAEQKNTEERSWSLAIVSTSLQTAAGTSSADVLAKLKDSGIDAELDPELINEEGFPVFSARIADLNVTDTSTALEEWAKSTSTTNIRWGDAQLRALHLANLSLQEITVFASSHPSIARYLEQQELGRPSNEDAVPNLRLVLIWPKHWDAAHQAAASSWARTLVVQNGWPENRILVADTAPVDVGPIELLDQISVFAGRTQTPALGVLLACESGIDQNEVDTLVAQGNLFSGKNPAGNKPGEVSASLLFADTTLSRMFGNTQLSTLHRASWSARGKSADERGKVTAEVLSSVIEQALETSKIKPQQIKCVSSDNDHRVSREAELAQAMTANLPELDILKDAVKVAQACGVNSHATTAAALCIAHQHVIDEQMPAVCISLRDPFSRAAVVMTVAPAVLSEPASAEPVQA